MPQENASNNQEWNDVDEKEKSKGHRSDRQARMEQDIKALANDDSLMAREVLLLKKELSRLHYKVKNYHQQSRVVNAIINTIVIGLLLAVLYKLYST